MVANFKSVTVTLKRKVFIRIFVGQFSHQTFLDLWMHLEDSNQDTQKSEAFSFGAPGKFMNKIAQILHVINEAIVDASSKVR